VRTTNQVSPVLIQANLPRFRRATEAREREATMKRTLVVILGMFAVGSVIFAAASSSAPGSGTGSANHPMVMSGDDVKWGDAPAVLPAGAQLAVLEGDPSGKGLYTVRLKMPDGYQIKPHTHPVAEEVTVLNGTFNVGMGKTFAASGGSAIGTGGFGSMPANTPHFAWTTGETTIQIHGMGPFAMTYVNAADDPSRK
jgi:quercetin dioxygenase-like cupin family protein